MAACFFAAFVDLRMVEIAFWCSSPPNLTSIDLARSKGPMKMTSVSNEAKAELLHQKEQKGRGREEDWDAPTPGTAAISSMFSNPSLDSICKIVRRASLHFASYSAASTPNAWCVKGLPQPRIPWGANLESETTEWADS